MAAPENDIRFIENIAKAINFQLSEESFSSIFVLVDENTRRDCLPVIENALPANYSLITIPAGEQHKTMATCEEIWQALTNNQADRHALMLNLGGGVICDMGGFCARTYKRGISFWNIPTTVLAQVDASVGGKLGVDFGSFKNHIGLFSEPDIVFLDPIFFNTLPKDEVISGFAEMIKHTLIRDVAGFEKIITQSVETIDWSVWIPNSVALKKAVIEEDPKEKGLRKVLNFGHTIGHAIESYFLTGSRPLKHGEAVALGMITETYLSTKKMSFQETDFNRVSKFLADIFPTPIIPESALETIAKLAVQDKKNKDGIINAVLLSQIGTPEIDVPISKSEIIESLEAYNNAFAK